MKNAIGKSLNEITQDDEEERFSGRIDEKLDVLWKDLEDLGRVYPSIPADDQDGLMRQRLQDFTAEEAFVNGFTKEEFLTAMGEAYDAVVATAAEQEEEEEGDEGVDPAIAPLINVLNQDQSS